VDKPKSFRASDTVSRIYVAPIAMTLVVWNRFIAAASFNRRKAPGAAEAHLPLVVDWTLKQGADARRLVDHADRQYGLAFNLRHSRRPWATNGAAEVAGLLWHVEFYSQERSIDFERLWLDGSFAEAKKLLALLEADDPYSCHMAFSSADDPQQISDSIGGAFEAILSAGRRGGRSQDSYGINWQRRMRGIGYRVTSGSMWTIVDESTVPVSLFGTGASTRQAPDW
jgi:hypothetical protein